MVHIWTILSHPQNLYGSRAFSILKTIFDILFPAAGIVIGWSAMDELEAVLGEHIPDVILEIITLEVHLPLLFFGPVALGFDALSLLTT